MVIHTSVLAVSALAGAGLATEGTLPTFLSALSSGRALLLMQGLSSIVVVSISTHLRRSTVDNGVV